MLLTILLSMFFLWTCCDPIEKGYKGIKPFQTSKPEVDKILGKSGLDASGFERYATPDAEIVVTYSKTPCVPDPPRSGGFNVPPNTVLSYRVMPKGEAEISQFNFDRNKFQRVVSNPRLTYASYVNEDETIGINFIIQSSGKEVVYEINYRGSQKERDKFACKEK